MTTTDFSNAAINYLVTTAKNTWGTDQATHVFDGPTPVNFDTEFPNRVWIGADPTKEFPGDEAVIGNIAPATLTQGRTLDESFDITCAIEHWDGGTDLAEARAVAFGYWATFQNFVRGLPGSGGPGDTTMGGALGTSGWSRISNSYQIHQEQQVPGCDVVIVFHVSCTARLT